MGNHGIEGSRSTRALDLRLLRFQNQPNVEEPSMLSRDLLAAGRLDDARVVFELAIERDPGDADLLLTGGELFLERGDFVWAKRLLIRAAQSSDGWASPWLALARLLLATRDLDRAEAVLERCWELAPAAPETWALDERLSSESALERRRLRFLGDPGTDDPAMLANALIAAGRDDDALGVLDRGIEAFPEDTDTLFVRARLHETRGELAAARADLSRATGADQSWATAWEALQDVCRQTGDHAAARHAETAARSVRERNEALADLDRAFMVGAAQVLFADLQGATDAAETLAEPPAPHGFAPVAQPRARASASADDGIEIDVQVEVEPVDAQTTPALELLEAAEALEEDDDLFPTYRRVHETLPPPPVVRAARAATGRTALPMDAALDSFLGALDGEPAAEAEHDTLVGHPAPEPAKARGLRVARGRKPYVPPAPDTLRPQASAAATRGDDLVTSKTLATKRVGRRWAYQRD